MPEPNSSPSNPAPEGGDFTEALPELQAALQADSDDITDIKDEVSKIEIHTDTIGEKLFEIADNASSLADNTPSREEKQEQKALVQLPILILLNINILLFVRVKQ